MTARLIAEEGNLEGLVLSFDRGDQWIIGRDPASCELVVEDRQVQQQHLLAKRLRDGQISLENLVPTSPPLINDAPLIKPRILKHGDTVSLGGGLFRFYTELGAQKGDADPSEAEPEAELEREETAEEGEEPTAEETLAAPEEFDTLFDEIDAEHHKVLAEIDFNLSETGRWLLKVIAGPNNGAEYSMEPGRNYIVGTAPNASDIVFHDVSVSRQHARISISSNNRASIEDLKSRNGTLVDDKKIEGRTDINSKSVISVGTTSFVVFDRESDRDTVITPLLPGIVRALQKEESSKKGGEKSAPSAATSKIPPPPPPKKSSKKLLVSLLGVVALFFIVGTATTTLFQNQEVAKPAVDYDNLIQKALSATPEVKYSFNTANGNLLLIGHVLRASDHAQLLYNLQGLDDFIRHIDDKNVVIDEYVVRESNQTLAYKQEWRGISLQTSAPGRFILSGYIKARRDAERLSDYMAKNFPYLDRLENNVIVEEDVTNQIMAHLQEQGLRDVTAKMNNGELILQGTLPSSLQPKLEALLTQFKQNPAVRTLQNYLITTEPEALLVDLTDSYKVSGSSSHGGVTTSVVINGRILAPGEAIDGMTVTKITSHTIYLDREGVKYKIEYNR